MAGHAQLKFVMTECSKTQIRLTGPNCKRITGFTAQPSVVAVSDFLTGLKLSNPALATWKKGTQMENSEWNPRCPSTIEMVL